MNILSHIKNARLNSDFPKTIKFVLVPLIADILYFHAIIKFTQDCILPDNITNDRDIGAKWEAGENLYHLGSQIEANKVIAGTITDNIFYAIAYNPLLTVSGLKICIYLYWVNWHKNAEKINNLHDGYISHS